MTNYQQPSPPPAELESLLALAGNEMRAGRLAEAAAAYQRCLALWPDGAEIHTNLANVLLLQGHLDEAAIHYRQALALKPTLFRAHNNLGNILRQQDQLDEAAAHYLQAIDLAPDAAEPYSNLGNVLLSQGKLDEAAAQFRRALALRPDLAEPYNNLGTVLQAQGQLERAAARFEQAIALRPDYVEAIGNLGNVLLSQRKFDLAAIQFRRALALKPDFADAHYKIGIALTEMGRLEQAIAQFERAVALDPDSFQAHNNLGSIYQSQGKLDQAVAHYDRVLALQPDDAQAHFNRAAVKTFRAGDAALQALEALAANPHALSPDKMLYIQFALGKALEDVGDHQRAFEHWLLGNAQKRRQIDYDEAGHLGGLRRVAEKFDPTLLERCAGSGDPSAVPIFILGMPRSGSTLIEQILASHPHVYAAGELTNLDRIINTLPDADGRAYRFPAGIDILDADRLRQLGHAYLSSLPPLPDGRTRITDKMPGNFFYVGLLRLILPNARIIHTVRDPVDTCISCFSKLFVSGHAFSYDLAELGRYYRGYHDLMAHWRQVLPAGALLDVSYEAVVGDLEQQVRRLIDFCGLPWDDRCLAFNKTRRPIDTASNVQVRRPIYRSSVARWRRYEAYLEPLLAELRPILPRD